MKGSEYFLNALYIYFSLVHFRLYFSKLFIFSVIFKLFIIIIIIIYLKLLLFFKNYFREQRCCTFETSLRCSVCLRRSRMSCLRSQINLCTGTTASRDSVWICCGSFQESWASGTRSG